MAGAIELLREHAAYLGIFLLDLNVYFNVVILRVKALDLGRLAYPDAFVRLGLLEHDNLVRQC